MGKLITYASGKSSDLIIWLVRHARKEHKAAIEWLNNHTDEKIGFFLCEIKLYQIGEPEPAVIFEVVEKPNDWTKEMRKKESVTETQQQRYDYWVAFQDYALKDEEFAKHFKRRSSIYDQLYIDNSKELFHQLYEHKSEIEAELGFELDWRELPEKKASRILITKKVNFNNRNKWQEQFDWLIEKTLKMRAAFKKYL